MKNIESFALKIQSFARRSVDLEHIKALITVIIKEFPNIKSDCNIKRIPRMSWNILKPFNPMISSIPQEADYLDNRCVIDIHCKHVSVLHQYKYVLYCDYITVTNTLYIYSFSIYRHEMCHHSTPSKLLDIL